jgi:PAS domain S-box-containing protein
LAMLRQEVGELVFERALAERTAWVRLVLTLANLAIIALDPTVPLKSDFEDYLQATGGAVCFLLYASGALWLLKTRRLRLSTYTLATPLLDVFFGSVLLVACHIFSRPFNLWFVFAIMVAGLGRYRMLPFAAAGLALVANVVVAVLPPTYPPSPVHFAVRTGYLFAIAAVFSYLSSNLIEGSKLLAIMEETGRRFADAMAEHEVTELLMSRLHNSLSSRFQRLRLADGTSIELGEPPETERTPTAAWSLDVSGEKLGALHVYRDKPLARGEDSFGGLLCDRAASALHRIRLGVRVTEATVSAERLKFAEDLIDNLPGFFFMVDQTRGLVRWNRNRADLTGYSEEELENLRGLDLVVPEHRERAAEAIARAFREGSATAEYDILKKDGSRVPCLATGKRIRLGEADFVVGTAMDISDRKQAEEALQGSESRNRTLIENLPGSVFYKDRNSVYVTGNASFAELLGVRPEDIPGKTDYQFFPKDQAENYHASDRRVMATGVTEQIEVEEDTGDGQKRWLVVTKAAVRDPSDDTLGVIGIIWDTTDRKKAEDLLSERLQFETLITDLSARLVSAAADRLDDEIRGALERLLGFFHVERAGLIEYSEEAATAYLNYVAYRAGAERTPERFDYASRFPWTNSQMLDGKVVLLSSMGSLPADANVDRATYEGMGLDSAVAVPIRVGDAVRYIVAVVDTRPRTWPEEFIPRLRLLGEVMVNALERRKSAVRLRERLDFETLVSDLSSAFVGSPAQKSDEAITWGLRNIVAFLETDRATLSQFTKDRDSLQITHSWTVERFAPARNVNLSEEYPNYVTKLRRGEIVQYCISDEPPEGLRYEADRATRGGIKAHLAIPLRVGGRVVGVLAFSALGAERRWPEQLIQRLRLIGEIFAGVLTGAQAQEALRRSREDYRLLAERLLTAQETERRRLAREVHDDLAQRLAVLAMQSGKLQQTLNPSSSEYDIARKIGEQMVKLSKDVHRLSRQLHPSIVEDLGLADALMSECASFSHREEIAVNFTAEDVPPKLPNDVALCVYRVAQEALRNVAKHAGTKQATVRLRGKDGVLLLVVSDEGVGFDPVTRRRAGLGLASMAERVRLIWGEISIRSKPMGGTVVEVQVPLPGSKR